MTQNKSPSLASLRACVVLYADDWHTGAMQHRLPHSTLDERLRRIKTLAMALWNRWMDASKTICQKRKLLLLWSERRGEGERGGEDVIAQHSHAPIQRLHAHRQDLQNIRPVLWVHSTHHKSPKCSRGGIASRIVLIRNIFLWPPPTHPLTFPRIHRVYTTVDCHEERDL